MRAINCITTEQRMTASRLLIAFKRRRESHASSRVVMPEKHFKMTALRDALISKLLGRPVRFSAAPLYLLQGFS